MPGVHFCAEPESAGELPGTNEAEQLKLTLQRKFEEDVARIFDESIYSDFELVCGKSKILTHSCILKARATSFYNKLENILNLNINRKAYDEIYSFISDTYTECNIKSQEKDIIAFIDSNLKAKHKKETRGNVDIEDTDVFLTPNCATPYCEKKKFKSLSSSPSIDLTKEYYALVPIDGSLLERELKEQDVLSNAFQSVIRTQIKEGNKDLPTQPSKPTSLSLKSSHLSKTDTHSKTCDNLTKDNPEYSHADINTSSLEKEQISNSSHPILNLCTSISSDNIISADLNNSNVAEVKDKVFESVYSPDSLITDDPSSSSDYLSATYHSPQGVSISSYKSQLNVGKNVTKMDNVITSSDSGLENTGLSESLNGQKDVTLTDVSLSESTLNDLITDDVSHSCSSLPESHQFQRVKNESLSQTGSFSGTSSGKDKDLFRRIKTKKESTSCRSSKEEKQRQNEEIVILESSSLSSETGSWESVFPPKICEKDACTTFLNNERQSSSLDKPNKKADQIVTISNFTKELCPSLVQKSPFKTSSCFIDAASLADDDDTIKLQLDEKDMYIRYKTDGIPAPSQPLPCSTAKSDISPNEWSESHDNDSLEQLIDKDPDSLQKDLSPTIFDMTPITEDSLYAFESVTTLEDKNTVNTEHSEPLNVTTSKEETYLSRASTCSGTPHNSIMSLKAPKGKQIDSEDGDSDTTLVNHEGPSSIRNVKNYLEHSPIVSGGASIEDHLPQAGSHSESPIIRRRKENIPIVSGAYISEEDKVKKPSCKSPKPMSVSAWVVDMSTLTKTDFGKNGSVESKKPLDRTCDTLRNSSNYNISRDSSFKSRGSADSDSSDKSSHKFYIDLSNLPDPSPPKDVSSSNINEKKNIFSMYIDLGEQTVRKEMPARLSSSLNARKSTENTKASLDKKLNISKNVKNHTSESPRLSRSSDVSEKTDKNYSSFDTPKSISYFEEYEALCAIPNISISEIIELKDTVSVINSKEARIGSDLETVLENIDNEPHNKKSDSDVLQKDTSVSIDTSLEVFVRLSDLDKPKPNVETTDVIHEHSVADVRMTRSIPDNSWADKGGPSKSIEVISSFHSENALSLNRLFPHLKNEISRSMPGSFTSTNRSPLRGVNLSSSGEMKQPPSDVSDVSSVQSSYSRSAVDNSSTEESQTFSLIGNCQSKLGQDLLRMFLEEIAPDVIVEVSGRRFKAHKCILSSRCQYFAGILSGGWVESAGNVIVLPPFSYNVVHFALCHIYSGVSTIPDSVSIVELATIADMLGLEGLKEAIMFTLKVKYCHHFHKPCRVCTAGVLECFPLSSVYGLDDLYRKCLKWITKYFHKVWPTKAFATLPKELLDKCYQQHMVNMTTDNVVDTVCGCGMTVSSLQSSRWAETVARLCRRLMNAAAHFAAARLLAVIRSVAELPADVPQPAAQALDDCLAAAIEWAPPEESCKAYAFLSQIVKELRGQKCDYLTNGDLSGRSNLLWSHANDWRLRCESSIVRSAPRAIDTQAFKDLPQDLRKRLRELGCIIYGTRSMTSSSSVQDRKSKSQVMPKSNKTNASTRSLDINQVRASFVPYTTKPAIFQGSTESMQTNSSRYRKLTSAVPKIRTTKAQEERAKYNLSQTNQSQERVIVKNVNRGANRFENTKPRYLEPRVFRDAEGKCGSMARLGVKVVSSSESSRNSSPVTARVRGRGVTRRASAGPAPPAAASRPCTAEPSTDSLSESQNSNKYATYTKVQHTKGSAEPSKTCSRPAVTTHPVTKNNIKTKIPVYLNHMKSEKPVNNIQTKNVVKVSGSLMMATKASSAKMVPKINKEQPNKNASKSKGKTRAVEKNDEHRPPSDIPVMDRSGTFLKDEPTFGDITTNIDIAQ